jgi:alpha-glucosidase
MTWWREAVFYQIYPRSFRDTDGDGIGDLAGITSQLDYLVALGVDALWITPIYPSPMKDFGYDVADYCAVADVFGSLEQFDELVTAIHDRGLRVILDWVPNHTSADHPWFIEARSDRTSAARDFYVWRDPPSDGSLPNNWLRSWSDDPAWTLDDASNQYYLHCFLPEQPDLNWANETVRVAMADTLRFWLDRGVDGFRMDVIHLIGKDPDLPDDPEELRGIGHVPLNDRPETHGYLREIRRVLDEYPGERTSVGEVYLLDPEAVADYYGDHDELHLSFNFASLVTPWRAMAWRDLIDRTEAAHQKRDAWPTWVLSNHDNQRVATRLRGDPQRIRTAMTLLLTLRGTPFLYAGEELGLEDADIPAERAVDPGRRDGCRAPIPWDTTKLHGWAGEPWLPFAANSERFAASVQRNDPASVWSFTRDLLSARHASGALRCGEITDVRVEGDVLTYSRVLQSERVDIHANFAKQPTTVPASVGGHIIISGSGAAAIRDGLLTLAASEAAVVSN